MCFVKNNDGAEPVWFCKKCQAAYEKFEDRLIQWINELHEGWLAQDLTCQNCNSVSINPFAKYCSCGGALRAQGESDYNKCMHGVWSLAKQFPDTFPTLVQLIIFLSLENK